VAAFQSIEEEIQSVCLLQLSENENMIYREMTLVTVITIYDDAVNLIRLHAYVDILREMQNLSEKPIFKPILISV